MKKIGIIGGLGPLATVDFFKKIVENTNAKKDQDNIPILIYNNPQIPDRTEAILNNGPSPVREIVSTGKILEKMGADFLVMPCNTSFYFYDQVQGQLDLKLINMIDLTVNYLDENSCKNVCILGTEGTLKGGVYYKKLEDKGINSIKADDELIDLLSYVIYDVVKKNNFGKDISKFINKLKDIERKEDVDVFVLACTELPILFEKYNLDFNTVDPTYLLALESIKLARKE